MFVILSFHFLSLYPSQLLSLSFFNLIFSFLISFLPLSALDFRSSVCIIIPTALVEYSFLRITRVAWPLWEQAKPLLQSWTLSTRGTLSSLREARSCRLLPSWTEPARPLAKCPLFHSQLLFLSFKASAHCENDWQPLSSGGAWWGPEEAPSLRTETDSGWCWSPGLHAQGCSPSSISQLSPGRRCMPPLSWDEGSSAQGRVSGYLLTAGLLDRRWPELTRFLHGYYRAANSLITGLQDFWKIF